MQRVYEEGMDKSRNEEKAELEMLKNSVDSEEQAVKTDDFSSPTPAKMREPSRLQMKEESIELSEKDRTLLDLFNRMASSLRLLRLQKRTPSFQNVSSQVEIMTGRKFTTIHLAQIKHILPEAVEIDKILRHDAQSKCMVPEMKIELLFDVVEGHGEESVFVALNNLFSSRLKAFRAAHLEDSDVPQAALPDPFNRSSTIEEELLLEALSSSSVAEIQDPSHLAPSFIKRFHEKVITMDMEDCLSSYSEPASVTNDGDDQLKTLPDSSSIAGKSESTPMKLLSGSESILVQTPVQSTPMRSISQNTSSITCEDENKTAFSQSSKQPTSSVKKSLDFCAVEGQSSTLSYEKESVSLSDLVPLIYQIFLSVNFIPITKEELVHKIIMFNCTVDDQSEVETQMEHLEKLVPDWFSKKLAPSGDLLYNVKKSSDLNSVRERINVI